MLRSYLAIGPVVARPASDGSHPVHFRSQLSRPRRRKTSELGDPFLPAPFARMRWRLSHRSIIGMTRSLEFSLPFLLPGLHSAHGEIFHTLAFHSAG